MKLKIAWQGQPYELRLVARDPLQCRIVAPDEEIDLTVEGAMQADSGRVQLGASTVSYAVTSTSGGYWVSLAGETYFFPLARGHAATHEDLHGGFTAPMPGKIIGLKVEPGEAVEKGQVLVIMEAMKMEHRIEAPCAGKVLGFHCGPGDLVDLGQNLLDFEGEAS